MRDFPTGLRVRSAGPSRMMTHERWQRMESIFHDALGLEASRRPEFVRSSCGADPELLDAVEELLAAFEEQSRFIPPEEAPSFASLIFGEYRVDSELGHGGMGTVYLAHRADGHFEQQVALKVVSAHLRTEYLTERFLAERQILAQLSHPNITRLLDGGVSADGDPYLVMEYVDGDPIHRYCDAHLLTIPERIRLFLQVCSAVAYAHRNLIVHRDLKPGNILVTVEGVPKLLDFGTAKLLQFAATDATITHVGMMTPRYASPEQLRGDPVTTLTDLYSLGVLLYELLTGAWPFGDPSSPLAGVDRAVRDAEPTPPPSVITEESARLRSESKPRLIRLLDGDLRSVLEKAMATDPRDRYTSVEQFSEDLHRCLDGQPVLARPQTLLYRSVKFVRRNWLPVGAATLFLLGLTIAIVIALLQARKARAEAATAEAVTRFLENVIYAGEPEDVRDRTVLQAMEIARSRLGEVRGQPEIELRIRTALGFVYMANSLLPQAEHELRIAEALARKSGNQEMLASALFSLSNVLFRYAESRAALMEALQIAENERNQISPNLRVQILSAAGQTLGFEKHSPEAERILRQAVEIGRSRGVPQSTYITALSYLGQYLRYADRLEEAVPVLNEALAQADGPPAISANLALEQLGTICIRRGELDAAERYYRQRRDLMMRLAGPDNGTTMDARSRWATLQARRGHLAEAIEEMRDNMAHSRKAFAAGSFGLWFAASSYAYVLNLADQPAQALPLAKEAVACFGHSGGPTDLRVAQVDAEMGITLARLHREAEARPYLQESLRIYSADPSYGPASFQVQRIRQSLDSIRPR
jgi:serine/threonine protein kinase/tetratricopeptide (TPR) repeat protein